MRLKSNKQYRFPKEKREIPLLFLLPWMQMKSEQGVAIQHVMKAIRKRKSQQKTN
jgi:hypothetical protein